MAAHEMSATRFRFYGSTGHRVALLHGGPGAPGHMAPLAQALADEFRVLEPFERHSGAAPLSVALHVRDLHDTLLRTAGAESGTVIGFSSGAVTALTLAARHPARVSSVVLISPATFSVAARGELKRRLERLLDDEDRARLEEVSEIADRDVRLREQARIVMPHYFADPVAMPDEEPVDGRGHEETWRDMLRLQETGIHPAEFAAVSVPVMMLHGRDDPHPGDLIRRDLAAVVPQLECVMFDRCGHYPWLEKQACEPFLRVLRATLRAANQSISAADTCAVTGPRSTRAM